MARQACPWHPSWHPLEDAQQSEQSRDLALLGNGRAAGYHGRMVVQPSFKKYVMAVDRVEQLLLKVSEALNVAGIDYAIIGGNAVAAWVARVDESAVRATKDVDVLLRRTDLARVTDALRLVDLTPVEVLGVYMFVDRHRPNPKTAVRVVFASERVRPDYMHPAPKPDQSVEAADGFRVIDLPRLVEMKLQAHRFIDRVHIQDLLDVGLIDDGVRDALPDDLRERLDGIEASSGSDGAP